MFPRKQATLTLVLLFSAATAQAEIDIKLEKAVFCRDVDGDYNVVDPINEKEVTIQGGNQICLWTRLRMDEAAYKYLQHFKHLTLTHCWKYQSDIFPVALAVSITPERWKVESAKALAEINGSPPGYFHWRTLSEKMSLKPGRYEVWMHDHRKRRVLWQFGDIYVDHIIVNVK